MRYIPATASDVIVQVAEDKNAYINVRNFGASGRGDLDLNGVVSDIDGDLVTITGISDQEGNSIFQYQDVLKQGVSIQVFGYRTPTVVDPFVIDVTSHVTAGNIDFSTSTATNPNLGKLIYFVFGYDAVNGFLPNHIAKEEIGEKIVRPDQWNVDQYVQLNFNRTSEYVLPVIFRSWAGTMTFLGVIGNNKVGYPGSSQILFRDLGDTEIPDWESQPSLPFYLSDIFSVGSSDIDLLRKVTAKETLEIIPKPFGLQTNYIQCKGLSQTSNLQVGDRVKFRIDDTKFVSRAILSAANTQVKEVFFPSGVYNITDSAFVNSREVDFSSISLKGTGDGSVIRRLPSSFPNLNNPGLINFSGSSLTNRVSGVRLNSLAFVGNRGQSFSLASPIGSEVTLQITNGDNVVISNCSFYDNCGGGIAIYNGRGVNINNNKIVRTGRSYEAPVSPLLVDTSENIVAQGNLLEFATSGPKIISTDFSTINSNIIRGCGDKGLVLETSFQWNEQGNLAYSDNDSLIKVVDTYNNEYSKATIEVRKGFALDPVYMTVTFGGESVAIKRDSIEAKIYSLNGQGVKVEPAIGSFRVLQTSDQLDAGIFSLSLPGGTTNQTIGVNTIPATGNLDNANGYVYEVYAEVLIGSFRPLSIRPFTNGTDEYFAIDLRNPSEILGFQIFSESDTSQNDSVIIRGFSNTDLDGLNQNSYYTIKGLDVNSNSILIDPIPELSNLTDRVEFSGGTLSLLRPDYFIVDGSIYVHSS